MIAAQNLAPALRLTTKSMRLFETPSDFRHTPRYGIKAAQRSSSLVNNGIEKEKEPSKGRTLDLIKSYFYQSIQGINRGIFGVQSTRKSEIEELVELLESQNPTPDPALHLEKVGGCWKLVYSTITILGAKRTKLGLRHFLTLGDIYQTIDVAKRVDICYDNSTITPDQLRNVLTKKSDLLLSIFNPEGWLEISYVDDTMMIGRDDKANTFVLERSD